MYKQSRTRSFESKQRNKQSSPLTERLPDSHSQALRTGTSPRPCSPKLQAGQLGETADNISAFLQQHRPSSPSSRSRPTTPTPAAIKQQQLQRIKAVHDAVQLFAQYGLQATPKLFHAVPAQPATEQDAIAASANRGSSNLVHQEACPYELQIVPRTQLPACYCTVTATGVVQVPGNGEPCIHTPIGMWMRNASMFRIFRALHAFKQVWQGSAIRRWHANMRQLVFQRNRQQLAQRLLLLKLPYLKLLIESRNKMRSVLEAGALQPMPAGLYKLEQLVDQQQEYQLSNLAPLVARTIAAIIADVEHTASRLQSSEQLLQRELRQYNKDPSAGAAQGLNSIKIRAERDAVAAKHASALYDLRRLPAFLRLLGLHVLQTYLDLLVNAVSGIKAYLEAPGNALVVDLVLVQGGVALSPSMEELLKGLSKGIIEHLVGVLKAAPRPLKHPSIAALLEDPVKSSSIVSSYIAARNKGLSSCGGGCGDAARSASSAGGGAGQQQDAGPDTIDHSAGRGQQSLIIMVNGKPMPIAAPMPKLPAFLGREDDEPGAEGGQLLMMMVGDQNLANLRRNMDQQVMRSYREASQVTDTLAELSVLLRFVHMWDPAAYKAKEHTVAQLRKDTLLLKEWKAQLQVVCEAHDVGLLQLQTGFLKTTYMAKLASAQATISIMLVSAARKECQAAVAELQSLTRGMAPQPSKLLEFIAFKLHVKQIWHMRDRVASLRPGQIADMYATATAWGGTLPHTDQVLLDDLREAVRAFNHAMTAANAFLDSRHAGMLSTLDRQAKEVLKKIQEVLKQMEAVAMAQRIGMPAATASTAGLALTTDKLAAWQQLLQDHSAASELINQQERQLGVKLTYYADLDEARRVLNELQEVFQKHGADGSATEQQ